MSVIEHLKVDLPEFQVQIPYLEIPDDQVTILRGQSGSGKTTVFRALLGLIPTKTFSWKFSGEDLMRKTPLEKKLGTVFQGADLFPHLTARENISFAAEVRGMNLEESEKTIAAWSENLGVSSILDRKAKLLSGGERCRIALLQALIGNPRYLLLDEPFAFLDERTMGQSRQFLKQTLTAQKIGALLISHDPDDAQFFGGPVFTMDQGRVELQANS